VVAGRDISWQTLTGGRTYVELVRNGRRTLGVTGFPDGAPRWLGSGSSTMTRTTTRGDGP